MDSDDIHSVPGCSKDQDRAETADRSVIPSLDDEFNDVVSHYRIGSPEADKTSPEEDDVFEESVPWELEDVISKHDTVSEETVQDSSTSDEHVKAWYGEEAKPCCARGCNESISRNIAIERRKRCQEMTKGELDAVILGFLGSHRRLRSLTENYGEHTSRGSSQLKDPHSIGRHDIQYYFADLPVCRNFFLFVHNLRLPRFKNLIKHLDEHGLQRRTHGSTGKTPQRSNVFTETDLDHAIRFIETYAEKYSLPLPGRIAGIGVKDCRVLLLPSCDSKESVRRKYCEAMHGIEESNVKVLSRRSFYYAWKRFCPHIRVSKPATDLCETCRTYTSKIIKSANMGDEVKNDAVKEAQQHLNRAKLQRERYNNWRRLARKQNTLEVDGVERSFAVLSFDFAEQVHYPSSAQQVGPAYFKTARKCALFGVHDERTGIQTNYLIDEADQVGKGANTVISLLHDYLSRENAEYLILFADNCCGQNKNNAMLHYLSRRVITGLNADIELNFLLAGHTKFGPDRNFGIVKWFYARSTVDSLSDLIECVEKSSPNGFNKAIATFYNGQRNVAWYKWNEFLLPSFSSFAGITKYHHFRFFNDGKIDAQLFADSAMESMNLLKGHIKSDQGPEAIQPEGLSAERQWYLFNAIRSLCTKDERKDEVAPEPSIPRPSRKKESETEEETVDNPPEKPPTSCKPRKKKPEKNVDKDKVKGKPTAKKAAAKITFEKKEDHEDVPRSSRARTKKRSCEEEATDESPPHKATPVAKRPRGRPKKL